MDCMPNEIISHIFHLILLDPEQNPSFSFCISQVCARWRELALTTPNLWTRIAYTYPITDAQHMCADFAIQRSGSQPLSILVDCRDPEWDWDEENHSFQWSGMQDILNRLIPEAKRWKALDILTDYMASHLLFPSPHQNHRRPPPPRGQTFEPVALNEHIPLFGGSPIPKLRQLCLTGVHIDWTKSSLRNLTCLEFKYPRHGRLEELTILGWGPQFGADPLSSVTAITIPSLTKLSFGFVDVEYGTQLLSLFQVPSLRELCLEDVAATISPLDGQPSDPLLEWLFTSQPAARASFSSTDGLPINPIPLQAVRVLELRNLHSRQEVFASLFKCFPNLIRLSCMDVSDEALLALTPYAIDYPAQLPNKRMSSRIGCLCPALEELYCQDSDPAVLMELVAERAIIGSVPPLRDVTLEYARTSRPHPDSHDYDGLVKTGIRILGSASGSEAFRLRVIG
ncbi:hypothetical protein DFP72DRAFT_988900 [Ephemerocybe angulata]|uniref:F-box domain-containing protein n=1 Tax=Ephemerocybe angulata TaxID=980116 RepID=A0A8H6I5D1_9AGAR|nr:hypothetical protein DFP72DRAFT_988900 [Tulosesus angulatus]